MAITNKDQIEKIKAKIKALLQKTTENGATEGEALMASQKVNELLQEYDLSFSDINTGKDYIQSEKYGIRRVILVFNHEMTVRKFWHESVKVAGAIGSFFKCEAWLHAPHVCFFGTEFDTQNAKDLMVSMVLVFDNAWNDFKNTKEYKDQAVYTHGKAMRADFMAAMAHRINIRLYELAKAREKNTNNVSQTAGALVIIKQNEVATRFETYKKDTGMEIGERQQSKRKYKTEVATLAGIRAGNAADLGTNTQKRFEKSSQKLTKD